MNEHEMKSKDLPYKTPQEISVVINSNSVKITRNSKGENY